MMDEVSDKTDGRKTDRVSYIKHIPAVKAPVIADNVFKEINLRERKARYDWPNKYKYLTGKFFNESFAQECTNVGLPNAILKKSASDEPIEHFPVSLRKTVAIPKTTSAEIGWRSSRAECNLEFPGQTCVLPTSMQDPFITSIYHQFAKQKFIFLG